MFEFGMFRVLIAGFYRFTNPIPTNLTIENDPPPPAKGGGFCCEFYSKTDETSLFYFINVKFLSAIDFTRIVYYYEVRMFL